jgi:hypothetical protein
VLIVDLRKPRVEFHGHEVRTRPPNHLQRQPLLALAVLATRPNEAVSMADLADGMFRLGGLRKRPVAPDPKDIRYRVLAPFKKALLGEARVAPIERLVEPVRGVGLRLNLVGRAEVRAANPSETTMLDKLKEAAR